MEVVLTVRARIADETKRVDRLLRQNRLLDAEFEKACALVNTRLEALMPGPGWKRALKSLKSPTSGGTTPEEISRKLEQLDADQFKEISALLESHNAALRRLRPPSLSATRALHALAHKLAVANSPSANAGSLERLLNNLQLTRLRLEAERADLATIHELDRTLLKSREKGGGNDASAPPTRTRRRSRASAQRLALFGWDVS